MYDEETGLYYVLSRYYHTVHNRWINADIYIGGLSSSLLDQNTYSYCFNSPLCLTDSNGQWPQWLESAVTWVDQNIWQPVKEFFDPSTGSVGGQFQSGIVKGKGSLTLGYAEQNGRLQINQKPHGDPNGLVGWYGKASILNGNGKIGLGNDDVSLSVKGVGDVLTVSVQAGLQYKNGFGFGLKGKAAVFSGRVTAEFDVFGWQVEIGVTGDALSIGAEAKLGVFDGAFEAKANASLGVGGGFVLRVKPPQ